MSVTTPPEQLSFATIPQTEKQPTEEKTEFNPETIHQEYSELSSADVSIGIREYDALKAAHPEYMIAFQAGRCCLLYGEDAKRAAEILHSNLFMREVEGHGSTAVTGFPQDQWASYSHRLWSAGNNVAVMGADSPDSPQEVIKVLPAKSFVPVGATLNLEDRRFVVESVDFQNGSASLRDVTFQNDVGYPIFRRENLDFVRSYWEEQRSEPENFGLGFLDWDTSGMEIQEETAPPVEAEPPALPQARHNFTIADADEIGIGGLKTKYKQNVAAIRLLKQIEDESRLATPDEQKILAKYVGWGGMPQAFDPEKPDWRGEYQELQGLLAEEEYRSARSTTLNAHYTSTQVIDAIYQGIRWLGFEKGNILEPAMGVGNFFGRLPAELRDSKLYGVELDDITGRLAGQLYQNADIRVTGFERTAYTDNFFDVAIGNVPFGSYSVADLKYDKYKFLIHDYFFAKALDQVRPGGLVAFVTSKGTMDKENTFVRQYLAERAELLGAIRLPNTAFKANANTEVTTDILFLQKKSEAVLTEGENKWFGLNRLPDSAIFVNEYFANHPDMMMGTMALDKSMYGNDNETALHDDGRDLQVALHEAVRTLPYNVMTEREGMDSLDMDDGLLADLNTRNYCYALINGEIYQRENSRMMKQEFFGVQAERVIGLIELRDQVRYLINIQTQDCPDDVLLNEQRKLNTIYDRFVRKFGAVSDRSNRLAFRDDADYPMLCALEIPEDETVRKADMFFKRTIRAKTEITSCDTSQEALTISLNEKGRLDLAYMSHLTGMPVEEITEDLKGVIFKNPLADEMDNELSGWETADEYLSGNVRRKLEIAKQTAETDPRYEINVSRLEQAQPEWLDASKIDVRLGATWVGTDTVRQFLLLTLHPSERTVSDLQVDYSPVNATWTITGRPRVTESDVEAFSTYGTARSNAYEIIDDLLN